jgi:hypothetical protein
MRAGEIRGDKDDGVIEFPENYEDMVKKLQEREDEQVKRLIEKRNVGSIEELESVSKRSIQTRSLRVAREHETLRDHTIQHEPKSQEIKSLRQQLAAEVSEYASAVFKQFPDVSKSGALKDRVTVGPPREKEGSAAGG